jgi:hypothetical protein
MTHQSITQALIRLLHSPRSPVSSCDGELIVIDVQQSGTSKVIDVQQSGTSKIHTPSNFEKVHTPSNYVIFLYNVNISKR